jgi:hypothetical protein
MEDVDLCILWPFGIFHDHLIYFMVVWYIFHILVTYSKKNLATLLRLRWKIV